MSCGSTATRFTGVSRSSALAPVSTKATGKPRRVHTRCSRSPTGMESTTHTSSVHSVASTVRSCGETPTVDRYGLCCGESFGTSSVFTLSAVARVPKSSVTK